MFKKILFANRGDHALRVATQPNGTAGATRQGD